MAFLDNSGDIILDAVLTDTGRYRLAKGDGSFKIVKFALGDDEINYELYNKNHASGSAYYDLEILQTPVFEAFTNNTSTMNSKLLSIPRTNLLYLPALAINSVSSTSPSNSNNNGFAVAVTDGTMPSSNLDGWMNGEAPVSRMIRLDQGLDTDEVSWKYTLDADLKESQYIVEIDSRLGSIINPEGNTVEASPSFIDDDNIASYYFSLGTDDQVRDIRTLDNNVWTTADGNNTFPTNDAIIKGPQGTCIRFRIKSSLELISSDYLFTKLGSTLAASDISSWGLVTGQSYRYIDSIVKVTGATTGYKIDIPVRFVKKTS